MSMKLTDRSDAFAKACNRLSFAEPVTHVYNPLDYARASHHLYLERYARPNKIKAIWLGMNPGPWGMAQTGVPFGEVAAARDFLGVESQIDKPSREHPKRPIQGFDCPRSEVSGRRVWEWASEYFGSADAFFDRFFILNYCPLCFMTETGKNFTPDKLPADERLPLEALCDAFLIETVEHLRPEWVIGVGKFAEKRARKALADVQIDETPLQFGSILHPSPASPAANRGWAPQAQAQLETMGLI